MLDCPPPKKKRKKKCQSVSKGGRGQLKKPPCICKTKKYISSPQDQVHRDLMNQAQEQGMLPGTLSGALLAAESGEVDIECKKVIATRVPLT